MNRERRRSVTHLEISYLPPSLMRVSMAVHFLMLSERVLMNCLVDLMPYASQTRVSRPQKNWAMVEPSSAAGVSEKMVSVAVENSSSRFFQISCSQGILNSSRLSCYLLLRLLVYMYLSQLMRTFTNYLKCIVISS